MTASPALTVVLRREKGGPELTREPVGESDLHDLHSEFWLAECLRRGRPDVPLEDFPYRLVPLLKDGGPRCSGLAMEGPGGARREFTVHSASGVAERAVRRLIESKELGSGDVYYYGLQVENRPRRRTAQDEAMPMFTCTTRTSPLSYLTVPLPPLQARARKVGTLDDQDFPVFYTEAALTRVERFARKGAASNPPIETGTILIGPLCRCPDTGEFYAVVCEALEVCDAEGTEFSLTYSSKSWARIQSVMKVRQAQSATRAHRILGQAHGHNFLPANGAEPCEMCAKVKVCTRTSVFVSIDDRTWSRAVFSRQPWQLCHIFGLNARNEGVQGLYGLRDGRLQERGYQVLAEFVV